MKMRYVVIPMGILLYLLWSWVALTHLDSWTEGFNMIKILSICWQFIHGILLFVGFIFLAGISIDYCEKHW